MLKRGGWNLVKVIGGIIQTVAELITCKRVRAESARVLLIEMYRTSLESVEAGERERSKKNELTQRTCLSTNIFFHVLGWKASMLEEETCFAQ